MRSNYLKIKTLQKSILIFSIIIGLGLTVFIPMSSAQVPYYPPFQYNLFNYGYFPLANPLFYTYQTRNAAVLLGGTPGVPTPGGGLTTLLPTLTPTLFPTLTPTITTPTIGITTALVLGGGGGGIATTLTLLNTIPLTTAPTIATTPTIGTTTAILLGGSINTTTLLYLGLL